MVAGSSAVTISANGSPGGLAGRSGNGEPTVDCVVLFTNRLLRPSRRLDAVVRNLASLP
jgi:hypothetical protein